MKLFTKAQYDKLVRNGLPENRDKDHAPVVKWFTPDADMTWLVSEIVDEQTAFGLCDIGHCEPELGYISIQEIMSLRGKWGMPVERDLHFDAKYPMSVFYDAARLNQYITEDESELHQASQRLKKSSPEITPRLGL